MNDAAGLFTMSSLATLQGGAAAAIIVPNVIGYLVGPSFETGRKWVSFGVALIVAFLAAGLATGVGWEKWILAIFNGFLIFASAMGINEASSSLANSEGGSTETGPPRRFFFTWLPTAGSDSLVTSETEVDPPPTRSRG